MGSDATTILYSGAADIVPEAGLDQKLALGRPLRVKLGVDPSRPDLTLGHAVVLRKLRRFQDLGHVAVLIIGDFTGRVGDPSGRSETRPMLSEAEMRSNAETYLQQAGRVLDMETIQVRNNSEWLGSMDMGELTKLASSATVAQVLDRDDFRTRYDAGSPISIVEFLYPLFQAKDSVAVQADVELGGTDQLFNLLMGREIQRAYGQDPQVVLTMPLLQGTDGVRKMSKSFDNYVGLTEEPDQMFGKLMSIPDRLTVQYLRLCTEEDPAEIDRIEAGLADETVHPNDAKRGMARRVVDLYHGPGQGQAAEARFVAVHRERELPDDVEEVRLPDEALTDGVAWMPRLLVLLGLTSSNAEARRLIQQGGVRLDGNPLADPEAELPASELDSKVLQVGRRRFVRLKTG